MLPIQTSKPASASINAGESSAVLAIQQWPVASKPCCNKTGLGFGSDEVEDLPCFILNTVRI